MPNNCTSRSARIVSDGPAEGEALKVSEMTNLKEVPVGSTVRVKKITGEGAVKRHIMDMGITKGTEVRVRKVAPLGDPVEVTVRGYELSLRKMYAEIIEVEMIENGGA